MIQELIDWSNKPYFLIDNIKVKLSMVLGVGLFTFLFLLVFQPYGIDNVVKASPFLILGYGILVSLSLCITYLILPKLFPYYFSVRSWTIKKEATFLLLSFFIISIINYLYHYFFIANYMPQFSFFKFMGLVLSIGLFPVLFIIFMVERYLYKKHDAAPTNIIEKIRKEKKEIISIASDNIKVKPLTLDIDDLLFAQSNNNYTTIVFLKDNKVKQELLRITLKKVNTQLEKYPQFIRCHRSFIINRKEIKDVKGNARSLQVFLNYVNDIIPVSRSFPKEKLTKKVS